MRVGIKYVNEALLDWKSRQTTTSVFCGSLPKDLIHSGDFISHPDFPDRWLVVVARHIDLASEELTLFLDLHPEHQSDTSLPGNVTKLR